MRIFICKLLIIVLPYVAGIRIAEYFEFTKGGWLVTGVVLTVVVLPLLKIIDDGS